jgi:hypothetical protein
MSQKGLVCSYLYSCAILIWKLFYTSGNLSVKVPYLVGIQDTCEPY